MSDEIEVYPMDMSRDRYRALLPKSFSPETHEVLIVEKDARRLWIDYCGSDDAEVHDKDETLHFERPEYRNGICWGSTKGDLVVRRRRSEADGDLIEFVAIRTHRPPEPEKESETVSDAAAELNPAGYARHDPSAWVDRLDHPQEISSTTPKIAEDGRCLCSCADKCPLGRIGSELRCTMEELNAKGIAYRLTAEAFHKIFGANTGYDPDRTTFVPDFVTSFQIDTRGK